jgi:hypothetical protein
MPGLSDTRQERSQKGLYKLATTPATDCTTG